MPAIRVRFARASERLELEELQRRASLIWDDTRAALLEHPDAIEIPPVQIRERRVRVAEERGRPVGFHAIVPAGRTAVDLDALFVEPARMREGIGALLIADAARLARRRGARSIGVVANPNALSFYQRVGFGIVGRTKTRFGPGHRMRLDL